jgi:hypothetical protein
MSASNSNLSSAGYNYDLVSALSQDALNNSLKALLGNLGSKGIPPITAYYVKQTDPVTGTTTVRLLTPDEVQTLTNGYDVFSIPNNTTNQNSEYANVIVNLATAGFAYAFEVTVGLPPEIMPYNLPDILILNQGNSQTVTYHSYYQTFKIVELNYISFGVAQIVQLSQDTYGPDTDSDGVPDNDPWIFEWQVNMNLSASTTTAFDSLPADVKQNLEDMQFNTNSMFSMQQLYLDLNSPRLTKGATPSVFNFLSTDPIYASLNEFISNYWTILQNNGGIIFNTAIKPVSTNDYPPSSIVPTAVNFVVSPYSGGTQGLYTLDYLIMSNNRTMPTITTFNWDWVNDDSVQGVMAVRRDLFISYLNSALSPALAKICYDPNVDVDFDGSCEIWMTPTSPSPAYNAHTSNPVLDFSFSKEAHDKAGVVGAIFQVTVDVNITSNVTFSGNTIIVSTIMSVYADIYTLFAHTKGYALATQNVTTFTMDAVGISQNNAGVLSITASVANTNLVQDNNKDGAYYEGNINDPSAYAEGITLGAINDYLDTLKGFTGTMNSLMDGFDKDIENICTNCLGWTFPGAGTYQFSNPLFSNYLDLTVQVAVQGN